MNRRSTELRSGWQDADDNALRMHLRLASMEREDSGSTQDYAYTEEELAALERESRRRSRVAPRETDFSARTRTRGDGASASRRM